MSYELSPLSVSVQTIRIKVVCEDIDNSRENKF